MSAVEYYNHSTYPATGAAGSSASLRSELELVEAGFGKLPDLSGNGSKIVAVNSGGTALEAVTSLTVAQGGTGRVTSTTAYALLAAGTTATGAHQTLAAGATTEILVGGGASALPVWTTATGTGAPVRATNCALVTPDLGTPSALVGTNITGTAAGLTAGNVTTNANLTGHVTSVGNAAVLGSFTFAQLNTAVSDAEVARTDAANTFTGTQTFSSLIAAAAGSVGAPSMYLGGDTTTGFYRIGANNWGFAVSGAKVLDIASTGLGVTGEVQTTGNLGIGAAPSATAGRSLDIEGLTLTPFVVLRQTGTTANTTTYKQDNANSRVELSSDTFPIHLRIGGTSIGVVSSTGLAVTGTLSATLSSGSGQMGIFTHSSTTGYAALGFTNNAGHNLSVGVGGATAAGWSQGVGAVGTTTNVDLVLGTNNTERARLSSTGLAVTGAISATGTSSLARIDQSNGSIDFASLGNGSTSWQIGTLTALKPLDIFTGGVVRAQFSDTGLAVTGDVSVSTKTPASASATGVAGTITWDASFLYVCTATDTWKRVAIATW